MKSVFYNASKYYIHRGFLFLKEAMPVMILVMLIFFGAAIIGFQKDNQKILEGIAETTKNTETIVAKQDETLEAIQQLALDSKLTSKQLGDTIICMLLIPVNQRTVNTQEECRQEAVSRTPASVENGSTAEQPVVQVPATPQPTAEPTPQPTQPEQKPLVFPQGEGLIRNDVPLLGLL